MFVFNAMETVTTPLSLKFFGWRDIDNSIYYSSAGLLVSIELRGSVQYLQKNRGGQSEAHKLNTARKLN